MDVRISPTPADFPIISTPGSFTGWRLTIEKAGHIYSTEITLIDTHCEIADKLRKLADKLEVDGD